MKPSFLYTSTLIINLISLTQSGDKPKTYSALNAVVFTNVDDTEENVHSEYYFGRCALRNKQLLVHDYYADDFYMEKMIIRGWMKITVEPNCVYVRATSSFGDLVKYEAFQFGICICKISYAYSGRWYLYYYYEWYIPVNMREDMEWDLFFYIS